jgi:uncharacterized protein involved in exopolysaccharide biosynthesis/Mrp family chromosome partitioning ATPase
MRPLDLGPPLRAIWRQRRLVAAIALLTMLAAMAVGLARPRSFEATTRLMLDPRGIAVVDRDPSPRSTSTDQSQTVVESEARLLASDVVLRQVIRKLALGSDPEFNGTQRYAWSPVTDAMERGKTATMSMLGVADQPADPELVTLRNVQRAVRARREPQSFVVELIVATQQGEKSARIANAIAAAYLDTRFSTQSTATQRASDTMSGRLGELRRAVEEAEARVEAYKREHDIVGASGRLVNEQQLSELNTQLVNARAEAQRAQTRLDQFRRLKQTGVDPESIDEALRSEIVLRLRTQFAALRQREASLGTTLLPNHPRMREVRQELADVRRSIQQEVARLADAAQFDLERARNNEKQLEKGLADLKALATSTSGKLVKLRELEQEAAATKQVYATFLVRSRELDETRRVDTSFVVPLATAVPPRAPSGLPLGLTLLAGLVSGVGLGAGAALLRDRREPRVRDRDHVEALVGQGRVVVVPELAGAMSEPGRDRGSRDVRDGADQKLRLPSFVLSDPTCAASRAVMRLGANIIDSSQRGEGGVALVTSTGTGEGKSTISVNLALAAAKAGAKVLLVDGDADQRSISDLIGAGANVGFAELAQGTHTADQAIVEVPPLGIDLLTAGRPGKAAPIKASRSLASEVAKLGQTYDLVVVDGGLLPSGRLLPAWARVADEVVVVARIDQTERNALADGIAQLESWSARHVSVALLSDAL